MEFFDLTIADVLLRIGLGLSIGFCIGLTGVGGGVLVLPTLTVLLGIGPVVAVGTTTLYAFLTKIAATYHHIRLKTIDWSISLRFLIGAVPANLLTAYWVSHHEPDPVFKQGLQHFIVAVIFFAIIMMGLGIAARSGLPFFKKGTPPSVRINRNPLIKAVIVIGLGAICGGLVGATSIGGGVLIVPMLILLFDLPVRRTVGSAIFIAFILTLLTAVIYGQCGEIDLPTAGTMAIGSLIGVQHGSRLSVRIPERLLRIIVFILVIAAAIMMAGHHGH